MKKPKIRFPEFTETYIEYRLGDIYQERKEGGNIDLPMLSVSIHSGISNGELDENELGKRVKRSEDKSLYKRVCQGDLVFNMMRAWQGAIGTAKIDGMVSPAYIVAKSDDKIDPLYMNYYMRTNHMLRKINNQSYGVMEFRKRLYWNYFSNIRCSVPSLSEQKRVAELLNMVETVIEKQKKTITAWEERKKGVMQKIFSQKVRFKDEDGNEFPEWKKKKIDDLFYKVNERNNGQFGKNKWISVARMYYQDEDKVTSNNIDTRTYVMRIGDMAFEGHPNKEFKYGRFVVNDIGDGVISELFPIYRHKEKYILKYWKYAIQVDAIMQKIYRKAIISSGASSNKLDDSDFKKQSILVPCLAEQQRIADCLSAIDDVINNYKETLTAWKELKKGLLQQMFV